MTGAVLRPLDLWLAAEQVLEIQRSALGGLDARGPDHYVRHAGKRGHRAFGAWVGADLVAFTYGHPCSEQDWWTSQVRPAVPAGALDRAFAVAELHVAPHVQRAGLGRALLRRLLRGVDTPQAVLSAYDEETPARRLYRSEGFTDLVTGFTFPTDPQQYAIMAAPLPLPLPLPARGRAGPGR